MLAWVIFHILWFNWQILTGKVYELIQHHEFSPYPVSSPILPYGTFGTLTSYNAWDNTRRRVRIQQKMITSILPPFQTHSIPIPPPRNALILPSHHCLLTPLISSTLPVLSGRILDATSVARYRFPTSTVSSLGLKMCVLWHVHVNFRQHSWKPSSNVLKLKP